MRNYKNYLLKVPKNVQVLCKKDVIIFKGRYGVNFVNFYPFKVSVLENKLVIKNILSTNFVYCQTFISLLQQSIRGASVGYKMQLELRGIGFRCSVIKNKLELKLGFSQPIYLEIPTFLTARCIKSRKIVLKGASKQRLSEFAHLLQNLKFPESFKGKGIFFKDQKILRKQGKKV